MHPGGVHDTVYSAEFTGNLPDRVSDGIQFGQVAWDDEVAFAFQLLERLIELSLYTEENLK